MKDVCFRDRYSQGLFENDKVRYAPDILFGYNMPVVKNKERKESEHAEKYRTDEIGK